MGDTRPETFTGVSEFPTRGFTLRELDEFVTQATIARVPWESVVYVKGTRATFTAPGLPFRKLVTVDPLIDRWSKP